jgi:hypothetical protein
LYRYYIIVILLCQNKIQILFDQIFNTELNFTNLTEPTFGIDLIYFEIVSKEQNLIQYMIINYKNILIKIFINFYKRKDYFIFMLA